MRHMNSSSDDLAFTDEVKVYNNEGDEEEEQEKSSENLKEDKVGLVNEGEEKTPLEFDVYNKQYAASMFKVPFSTDPRFANYFMSNYPAYMNGNSTQTSFMNNKMSLMSPPVPNPFSFIPFPIHDPFAQNGPNSRYQLPEYKRIAAAAAAAHFYSLPSTSSHLHDQAAQAAAAAAAWGSSCSDVLLSQTAAACAAAVVSAHQHYQHMDGDISDNNNNINSSSNKPTNSIINSTSNNHNRSSSFSVSSIASTNKSGTAASSTTTTTSTSSSSSVTTSNPHLSLSSLSSSTSSNLMNDNSLTMNNFSSSSTSSSLLSSTSNNTHNNTSSNNNSCIPTGGMPLSPSMFAAAAVAAAQAAAFSSSSPAGSSNDVVSSSLHKAAAAHLRFLSSLHYQQSVSNGYYSAPSVTGNANGTNCGNTNKLTDESLVSNNHQHLLHNSHINHQHSNTSKSSSNYSDSRYNPPSLSHHLPPHHLDHHSMRHHNTGLYPTDCNDIDQRKSIYSSRSSIDQRGSVTSPDSPKKPHIKKPLNAFMLFMKEMRPKVQEECTLKESAAINQILGKKWHELSREDQTKYYELARKEKELHQQLYPGWSARDNYAAHSKRRKKRKLLSGSGAASTNSMTGSVGHSINSVGGPGSYLGPPPPPPPPPYLTGAVCGPGGGSGSSGSYMSVNNSRADNNMMCDRRMTTNTPSTMQHPYSHHHHHHPLSGPLPSHYHTHHSHHQNNNPQPHHPSQLPHHGSVTGNVTGTNTGTNPKKCRARFGLEHQNLWCKPCRRKKKCVRFIYNTTDDSLAELVQTSNVQSNNQQTLDLLNNSSASNIIKPTVNNGNTNSNNIDLSRFCHPQSQHQQRMFDSDMYLNHHNQHHQSLHHNTNSIHNQDSLHDPFMLGGTNINNNNVINRKRHISSTGSASPSPTLLINKETNIKQKSNSNSSNHSIEYHLKQEPTLNSMTSASTSVPTTITTNHSYSNNSFALDKVLSNEYVNKQPKLHSFTSSSSPLFDTADQPYSVATISTPPTPAALNNNSNSNNNHLNNCFGNNSNHNNNISTSPKQIKLSPSYQPFNEKYNTNDNNELRQNEIVKNVEVEEDDINNPQNNNNNNSKELNKNIINELESNCGDNINVEDFEDDEEETEVNNNNNINKSIVSIKPEIKASNDTIEKENCLEMMTNEYNNENDTDKDGVELNNEKDINWSKSPLSPSTSVPTTPTTITNTERRSSNQPQQASLKTLTSTTSSSLTPFVK